MSAFFSRMRGSTSGVKVDSSPTVSTSWPPRRSMRWCRTSTVAAASSRARCVGLVSEPTKRARSPRRKLPVRVRSRRRRASVRVSTTVGAGQGSPSCAQDALRKPMSKGALCATHTAPSAKRRNSGSTVPSCGLPRRSASRMPVSRVMAAGRFTPGSMSAENRPCSTPPRTRTAPISMMWSSGARIPVVSRSTTTNVVSASAISGVPVASPKLSCIGSSFIAPHPRTSPGLPGAWPCRGRVAGSWRCLPTTGASRGGRNRVTDVKLGVIGDRIPTM